MKLKTNCVYFLGQNDLLNDRSEDCGWKKRIKYVKIIEIPIPSWSFFSREISLFTSNGDFIFSFSPQTTSIIYNDGFCERHSCHAFLLLVRAVDSSFFSLFLRRYSSIFSNKMSVPTSILCKMPAIHETTFNNWNFFNFSKKLQFFRLFPTREWSRTFFAQIFTFRDSPTFNSETRFWFLSFSLHHFKALADLVWAFIYKNICCMVPLPHNPYMMKPSILKE